MQFKFTPVSSMTSEPINKFIVNTIPQSAAVPLSESHDKPEGRATKTILIASQQNEEIPI